MLSCETCGTLQRYSNISKTSLCKYLSDASHFTTLVLRTTLSTGTNKQRSCSKGENKPNTRCFRLTELSFRTECLVNSSLIFLNLLRLYHFPQSISSHTPLYRCLATPSFLDSSSVQIPIRVLISAHGVSRLKKKSFLEGWINLSVGTKCEHVDFKENEN